MWTTDQPTEQFEFLTTPLNNVNYRPTHWTMWILDNPTEQCELQTNTLNNVNSWQPHWTMGTTDHPTEQWELQTTPWFRCGMQRQPLWGWLSVIYKEENPVLQSNTPCPMHYMYKKMILCRVHYDYKLLYCLYIQFIPCKQLYLYDLSNAHCLEFEIHCL